MAIILDSGSRDVRSTRTDPTKNRKMEKSAIWVVVIWTLATLYTIVTWIDNIVHLISCDFAAPYNEEIIRILGIFIPFISWVVFWVKF